MSIKSAPNTIHYRSKNQDHVGKKFHVSQKYTWLCFDSTIVAAVQTNPEDQVILFRTPAGGDILSSCHQSTIYSHLIFKMTHKSFLYYLYYWVGMCSIVHAQKEWFRGIGLMTSLSLNWGTAACDYLIGAFCRPVAQQHLRFDWAGVSK